MTGPLLFQPLYQERVWGGRALEAALGRALPSSAPIGESWDVVDRPEAQSVVASGPHAGRTLRSLLAAGPAAIMGPGWDPARPFPILVKWLDCRERLSLQVHPPASAARALGGEPKTENWFIAAARPDAALVMGLARGATREAFARAAADGALEPLLHRVPVRAGDSAFVPSGRLHAIDAGNLVLEIQQNSDTTYRVCDWGRTGLDGRPRALHLRESMACIDFDDFEPALVRAAPGDTTLAECPEFRIRKLERAPGQSLAPAAAQGQPRLLHLVQGRVSLASGSIRTVHGPGDTLLLPADTTCLAQALDRAVILLTDRFSGPCQP